MTLSREEVEHVAQLARLGLTEDEKERMRDQLSSILENMEILKELDTSAISPTAHVLPLRNVVRPDEVQPSLPVEGVLQNAPRREEDYFRILPVFEEDYER
ncbi:MAG: Asp-tRNA(Asn)/Glu-tRNA(Gln) amidotransferase subunit GatC [Chloroflexi bacterium]|nr:Asp-tRNA(Asn)/Glu-tRNA(Gln) amidotransferase subunit GatC [Chloroflexota bacterium]MDA8186696.1 Asp-tRNA(Asn)/Glu-tRNA(Gln) amidotransferase subunit GatC [Dehalococcoidales bacterium]